MPAVGRGGVLDLAARWANSEARIILDNVHRFADQDYAKLSLAMRTGENPNIVFDQLAAREQISLYPDEASRTAALAEDVAGTGGLVVADTREQVADLNQAIRGRHITNGRVDDSRVIVTNDGERIGIGDRVATRANAYDLGVANRDTWAVAAIRDDGSLQLVSNSNRTGTREVPRHYAVQSVDLAYASTVYGAQGDTIRAAHLVLGEHTGAASAYVVMTRGREANTAHIVAENRADARQQWARTFSRNRADFGPAHAATLAIEEAAKYDRYASPRQLARPDHLAGSSRRRRHPDPIPTMSRPADRGPGIGF